MGPLLLLGLLAITPPGFLSLRVVATGDICCRVTPSPDFAAPGLPRRELGGWESLARLIADLRTDATLVLDCGGFAFGSAEGRASQGRAAVRMMNLCRYDAATLGSRDFAGGAENVEVLAKAAQFPMLADPMLDVVLSRRVPMFRPYLVRDVKGAKVAVIGLSDPDAGRLNRNVDTKGFAGDEPAVQVRRYLAAVRQESPDIIIALGHIATEQGAALLDSFPELDLVVCPAARDTNGEWRMTNGEWQDRLVLVGPFGQRVETADILFDRNQKSTYRVEKKTWNVLPGKPDSAARVLVKDARVAEMDTPACYVRSEIPAGELGATVAEAVRRSAGADIALLGRNVVNDGLAQGRQMRRALFDAVPFCEPVRLALMDDTTLHRFVAGLRQDETFPLLAGADLFVLGDSAGWPLASEVARLRVKDKKPVYRVAATEQMLEQAGVGSAGRLVDKNLSELWLDWASAQETLPEVPGPKLHRASAGLAARPDTGSFPVNINTANQALLEKLPGVGPKTAERIIEYRTRYGRFGSVDELINVKGIGPKTLEKMRPLATVR